MDDLLYTDSYEQVELEPLPPSLVEALEQLAKLFPEQPIKAYYWDEHHVAIPVNVSVNLPTRGTVDNVDIREEEPIILVFPRNHYPYQGPRVYSNRRDFPRNQLPHLNPVYPFLPISFCLYRGNFNDWMAEHNIADVVALTQQWLSDAARNRLIPPGDGWEAMRIDEAIGIAIYPPEQVESYIQQQWNLTNGKDGFAILHCRLRSDKSPDAMTKRYGISVELLDFVEAKKADKVVKDILELNRSSSPNLFERHLLGILIWPTADHICDSYFANIPRNLEELFQWEATRGMPLARAIQVYVRNRYRLIDVIPIMLGVRRPFNLIGRTSDIELINLFVLLHKTLINNNTWDKDAKIFPLSHRTPLTTAMAREISRSQGLESQKFLICGCGAVGSKLVLQLARSGCTNLTLVDDDELSPHNLVRHALLGNSVGRNKAVALRDEITAMFREKLHVQAIEGNGINTLLADKKKLRDHTLLIDTTASTAFLRAVIDLKLPDEMRVIRAELAHEGQIGVLGIEGSHRNPRLDDVYAHLFDLACENANLSHWLQKEQIAARNELRFEEVAIGIGCHTDTMRLADDVISFHAAYFSRGFTSRASEPSDEGYLQVSFLDAENDISSLKIEVPKFLVIHPHTAPDWEVRITEGARQTIDELVRQAGQNETGGVLIGRMNPIRKTIHVTKALPPPPDSQSTPYMFVRGIQDVWDSVREITSTTGNFIYYVGEWHSHPMGNGQMSQRDKETARQLQSVLRPADIPTHILIATPSELVPHLYLGTMSI
jgi:hypothetical protein